jgi:hypothetical protein
MIPGLAVRQSVRSSRQFLLLLVALLVVLGLGFFQQGADGRSAPNVAQADGTPAASPVAATEIPCDAANPDVGFEPWVQSELYFGAVGDEEWDRFLDEEVTPRFPDGLTVLTGYGQWRNSAGEITQEDSIVLIILYPLDSYAESSQKLQEIREEYKAQFDQESVLRVDSTEAVCVSF